MKPHGAVAAIKSGKHWFAPCLLLIVALVSLATLVPKIAAAQTKAIDPALEWAKTAQRAEQALQSGEASSDAFEVLRSELATQRADADAIVDGAGLSIRLL